MPNNIPEQQRDGNVSENVQRDERIKKKNAILKNVAHWQESAVMGNPEAHLRWRIDSVIEEGDNGSDNDADHLPTEVYNSKQSTPAGGKGICCIFGNRNCSIELDTLEGTRKDTLIGY
jgi:hypothetical protein